MFRSQRDILTTGENRQDFRPYLTREPIIVALLSAAAVALFLAVTGLSHIYHAQQRSLGNRWFTRGSADLKERRFEPAVSEFRTALRYSRDNYSFQLSLAEALIGRKRSGEAYSYLINLWEREPENGLVNLELARIAVQKGQTDQALRYYHNAIYATWPGDQEVERRNTRLELIEFLLHINAKVQAQSELIALAANLADDSSHQAQVGDLFLEAQDYEHALAEYRLSLKSDRRNPAALAGAGRAAFELGRYPLAQRYLQGAVAVNPSDSESAAYLKAADLVIEMDPFRRQLSVARRNRIVMDDFAAAGQRLKSCSALDNSRGTASAAGSQPSLADSWSKMKTEITERGLRRNPDLMEAAMDLVFKIERQTSAACGSPVGTDMALLLIAKLHEGS